MGAMYNRTKETAILLTRAAVTLRDRGMPNWTVEALLAAKDAAGECFAPADLLARNALIPLRLMQDSGVIMRVNRYTWATALGSEQDLIAKLPTPNEPAPQKQRPSQQMVEVLAVLARIERKLDDIEFMLGPPRRRGGER